MHPWTTSGRIGGSALTYAGDAADQLGSHAATEARSKPAAALSATADDPSVVAEPCGGTRVALVGLALGVLVAAASHAGGLPSLFSLLVGG